MATTPQQGIMALPETDEATTPQLSLNESYGAAKEGLADADPQYAAMYQQEMSKVMPTLMALSDQELDALLQLIQYLQEHPEEYTQRVQEMEADGTLEKGALPAEYDDNFLAVFGAAILEAQRTNEDTGAEAMQPPMQLAKGGIAEAARMVARQGRSGDTMLAHITKDEAALLKKHGGVGTRNPRTGLREYGLWSSVKGAVKSVAGGLGITKAIKAVGSVVKTVLASPLGRIVATVALAAFLGPAGVGLASSTWAAAGLASAGITALGGGNLKDVVKAGVTGAIAGYGAQALGPALGSATGVTNAAGQAALGAGAAGTGLGALQGKSIKDSVKDGMTAALIAGVSTGASEGFNTKIDPATGKPVPVSDASAPKTPAQIQAEMAQMGTAGVNPQTGQVTGGAPVPMASSNSAFDQALYNAQQGQINGLTMDSGTTTTGPGAGQPVAAPGQVAAPVTTGNLSSEPGITVRPGTADPMGEFIKQNEAWRQYASNPAGNAEPSLWQQTKDYFSPSSRAEAGAIKAGEAYDDAYNRAIASGRSESAARFAADAAAKGATPGVLSNYGPAIAAGLGATALMGGFKQEQPESPNMDAYTGQTTRDLMNADPSKVYLQNMSGVTYDDRGKIISSAPWTPRPSGPVEVGSSAYIPYSSTYTPPPTYTAPTAAVGGGRQIAQPYNTASMYDFRPRYAAQGGMMETQGAFPANPLTMQSSPMMAMGDRQLPMNTSGVPMNLPMGFAAGGMPPVGIASLAPGGYPRRTGQISGPGTETSDDIPAMLSDGEFVMTAKAVKGMGGGSRRAGAKKMYALMHRLEKNAARG